MLLVMQSDSDSACQDLFNDNNQLAVHYPVINNHAPAMAFLSQFVL